MNIDRFKIKEKSITLYHSDEEGSPLIILNNFEGEGQTVFETVKRLGNKDLNLMCIGTLDWDNDMTPWQSPGLTPKDPSFSGGADAYLEVITTEIIPAAKDLIKGKPSFIGIAGYSLAGLFALYSLYRTDVFDRAASISGSLWFPKFKEYVLSNEMKKTPQKIYISLGDKEAKTRNQYMKTVQDNTEDIADHYRNMGLDVTFEMNQGNHFKDALLRTSKGILSII